ncbi:MAG: heparin lyase I family protein [Roseicyclus sp.]|uniref:heparin lyase I family protein n=1 Tax=Roseicyclus sp. TaxID=1914329 RepID=UPI003A86667F
MVSVIFCAALVFAFPASSQTRAEILDAQIYLNGLGYGAGAPDGVWGPNTASALNAFLADEGLDAADILTAAQLTLLQNRVNDLSVQLTAVRLGNGQPYDPFWPQSGWHPDMQYDADHNFYRGGFSRHGWYSSGTTLPHQFNIVSAPFPVRYGTHSERFEIRPTDYDGMENRTEANRSEIGQRSNPRPPSINQDIWFGWSFYYDDLPILDSSYGWYPMFGQWKRTDMEGAPLIALRPHLSGTRIGIHLDDMTTNSPYMWRIENRNGFPCSLFDIQQSASSWIDIVINTDFGSSENGYLNVWVNGELICEYQGQIVSEATVNAGHDRAIHKRGYWSGHLSFPSQWRQNHPDVEIPTVVVYYDEWRQGSSREEVDIRLIEARGGEPVD